MIDYVEIKTLFNIEKGSLQSSKYVEGEYDFVTASSEWKKHKEYTHDTEALIVAVAASGSLGRVHYVNGKFIASDLCFILTPKSKDLPVDLSFYYYIFKSIRDDLVKSTATGTSKLAINKTNFGNYKVPYVDIAKQKEYKKKLIHVAERKEKLTNVNCEQVSLIQNLRSQILQDAITGKLSEQWRKENPNIESAEILLEKIKAEKEKLIKEGKLKKEATLAPIIKAEIPFEIPPKWCWVRLGEVTTYGSSQKILPDQISEGTWVLDLEDIEKESSRIINFEIFPSRTVKSTRSIFKQGDVLYSKLRPYLDKVVVAPKNGVCTTEILPLPIYSGMNSYYLMYTLKRKDFLLYANSKVKGMKMPRLRTEDGSNALIPLPPLDEQHHIVDRIKSLFTKLDNIKELNIENRNNIDLFSQVVLKEIFDK